MTNEAPEPAAGRRARRVGTSIAAGSETPPPSGGRRKAVRPGRVVAKVIVAALLVLGLVTGAGVVLAYDHWNGNLTHTDISAQLKNRPAELRPGALNILVMGSDSRAGKGDNIDGMKNIGERSDTTIMFHLSADRKFAYGISVPRDTLVDRPTCYKADGAAIPAEKNVMWNDAFSVGGAACTVQQFEQLTGIRIDNYVVVDFNGFKNMVNALDGVEVCIPEEIDDTQHNIKLMPGTREIKGQEALSYVRLRYRIADGMDTSRIKRQQAFMASMIKKVVSAGTLARPDRVVKFLNALTSSLQTDFKNIAQMASVAEAAKGVGLNDIKFVTTPWELAPSDPNRVQWLPSAQTLFSLAAHDKPLTKQFLSESISADENPNGSVTPPTSTGGTKSPSAGSSSTPTTGSSGGSSSGGLSQSARENAGLCT
ncbi:LCP family protein [Nocardioides ultimimeridianus]